jgi:hypothetical protein
VVQDAELARRRPDWGYGNAAVAVEHDHTHDSLRANYRRARREAEG